MNNHKVIIGDSRKMHEVKDESVHLIITSPPYWQLKDYGPKEQIGYNDSYEEYINKEELNVFRHETVMPMPGIAKEPIGMLKGDRFLLNESGIRQVSELWATG